MSSNQDRTIWYKSHNYVWIENLRDQDNNSITNATIEGVVKDSSKKEIESVFFSHDSNGNYFTELTSNSKTVNLNVGSNITMELTIENNGKSHYIQRTFIIDIDRG